MWRLPRRSSVSFPGQTVPCMERKISHCFVIFVYLTDSPDSPKLCSLLSSVTLMHVIFFFRICFTEEESGFKEDIPFICSHTVHIDPWFECRYIILEAQAFYLYFNCSLAPYKTHSLITSLTLQVEGVSNRKVVVIAAGFSTSDSAPGVIAGAHLPSEFCELEAGRVDLDQLHHQYFLGVMDMSRR